MWQAEHVASLLSAHGVTAEIVGIETKGDKVLDTSIAKIGSKGVFTEELEDLLQSGDIDIAVHSAKDLQSSLDEAFEILAFSEREQTNDVLISNGPIDLSSEKLVVGTSSTRRVALFRRFYPNIKLVDMRGNLQTRIEKMTRGDCDALALAFAGVHRMGYGHIIREHLSFIPAVGQGSLAIECAKALNTSKKDSVRSAVNDDKTEKLLLAERSFLRRLDGGCSIPVFAEARYIGSQIEIEGGIISLDGRQLIIEKQQGMDPEALGLAVADIVLQQGGGNILKEIKSQI